jgi:hypothetical protein
MVASGIDSMNELCLPIGWEEKETEGARSDRFIEPKTGERARS